MNRREVITAGAGILAAGILKSGAAFAANPKTSHAGAEGRTALIDAALDCIASGEICHQHCLEILGQGDKSMAECSKTVTEMLTMCRALLELAAQKSPHLPKLAAICADVCKNCEKACRQHEMHMAICKNCAESCARCAAECAKVAA